MASLIITRMYSPLKAERGYSWMELIGQDLKELRKCIIKNLNKNSQGMQMERTALKKSSDD